MKNCQKCGTTHPLSEFYSHPKMADGHLSFCKSCVKARVAKHRIENMDHIQEYDRERGFLPHRVASRREYADINKTKIADAGYQRMWIARNSEKRKAHNAVNNAVRDGILTKLNCEVCGDPETHGHHDDYSKPLVVRWMCQVHHMEYHRVEREKFRRLKAA